jgi:hypothetical protein
MSNSQERRRLARQLRVATRADRQRNRARRRVATLTPQPARVWLVNLGVSPDNAQRFAPAFSRGLVPTRLSTTKIKPRKDSRRSERTVPVKEYNFLTVVRRLVLEGYRPKTNPEAAAEFARAAALVS